MHKVTPFLWFNGNAEEAMNYYVSIFPNSKVVSASPMGGVFELDGQRIMTLNGGPEFTFTEAVSLYVDCATQEEVDRYWDKLTVDGGAPGNCGWLKDKYGLSWQIVPSVLWKLMRDPDQAKSGRVVQALMQMTKIDVAGLQAAYNGL